MAKFFTALISFIAGAVLVAAIGFYSLPGLMIKEIPSPYSFDETLEKIEANAKAEGWKVPKSWKVNFQKNLLKVVKIDIGPNKLIKMCEPKAAADILKGRKVAPGVVLKIVPATDRIWKECLDKGLIDIFKKAGALIGNAGCAGCAAGQIGQNGPGEVTLSTGNRNFAGKQGKGEVYLTSPAIAAASAVSGMIALPGKIPSTPAVFTAETIQEKKKT